MRLFFSSTETTTTTRRVDEEAANISTTSDDDDTMAAMSNLRSSFLTIMRDRGYLHQCTDLTALDELLFINQRQQTTSSTTTTAAAPSSSSVISAYLGFDATADSLHVGSLLQIMILRIYQQCGHRPIVLIGGGTSKVGDPTGKDTSRRLLTNDDIASNIAGISTVFRKFLTFRDATTNHDDDDDDDMTTKEKGGSSSSDAIMVNNDDWLSSLHYLQFLRDYGTHFTINRMLNFESVKQRLDREAPFTFLEFNYMILQAYDFLELSRRHGAMLQLGGSDQWGNMISGVELGRRVDSTRLYALTAPLITTSDGKKMGKTANGAVWLNVDKLSEYNYWQFWRNTSDEDVIRFLKLFTELPLEEINTMASWTGSDINKAKIILADEATALLHGRECLPGIHGTISGMFGGEGGGDGIGTEGLTRTEVYEVDVAPGCGGSGGIKIVDLLVRLGLASSKKDAKRLIAGGGAKLGEEKIVDEDAILTIDSFTNGSREVTLRAGKKRAGVVELK